MRIRIAAAAVVVFLGALPAVAGPRDTRVGETRFVYAKAGTVIRGEGAATATPVATLPSGTLVVVQEVKLPWVKVQATPAGATAPVTGWLRAFEAIEQTAIATAPPPAHVGGPTGAGVSDRDASAAGRQFTADTEQGYRASRAEVTAAYVQLDAIEKETAEANPYDSIEFIMGGDLGRGGHDYLLPPRIPFDESSPESPPEDMVVESSGGGGGGGGFPSLPGGLGGLGGLGGRLGGRVGGNVGKVLSAVGKAAAIAERLQPYVKAVFYKTHRLVQADFTPTQEYYLGRAVAANAIARYGLDSDANRRRYVKRIGDAVVRLASPEQMYGTVGGYHFDVLNSDEINGVSGPGGYVLLTRGAVNAARTEDEVAALISHELMHIRMRHGVTMLKASKAYQSQGAQTEQVFEGWTGDGLPPLLRGSLGSLFGTAATEIVSNAGNHAYGAQFEFDADRYGTGLLADVYYDWGSLRAYLARMSVDPMAGRGGADHAAPAVRVQYLDATIQQMGGPFNGKPAILEERETRFRTTLGIAAPGK